MMKLPFRKKKQTPAGSAEIQPADLLVTQPGVKGAQRMHTWVRGELERSLRPVRETPGAAWIIGGCVVALVATQLVLIYAGRYGLFMNAVVFAGLLTVALLSEQLRKLATGLAILPATQMAVSVFVLPNAFQQAMVFYSLLLVLTLVYRYLFTLDSPVERSRLRLKGHAFGLPLMLIMGEAAGLIGYAFMRNHYAFDGIALPLVAVACIVFAFAEEMFLRGLFQNQAELLMNPWWAAGLAAVLYAVLAFTSTTLLSIGPAVAMGVTLALVYKFKQNLLLSITINAAAKLTYVGLVATFVLR